MFAVADLLIIEDPWWTSGLFVYGLQKTGEETTVSM